MSAETVKAHGPKRALLLGAFEQAFAGVEGDEPISESDMAQALADIPDSDDVLAAIAHVVGAADARTSVLWSEFLAAANADRAVAPALTDLLVNCAKRATAPGRRVWCTSEQPHPRRVWAD